MEATEEQCKELEKVMEMISDAGSRRKFLQDPKAAVGQRQVAVDDKIQVVIDALAELSSAELRLLATLNRTMLDAGYRYPGSKILACAV